MQHFGTTWVGNSAAMYIYCCFPPEIIIVCRVSPMLDASEGAALYLTWFFWFSANDREREQECKKKKDREYPRVAAKFCYDYHILRQFAQFCVIAPRVARRCLRGNIN
jgi:hypothetical protein